MFKALWNNFYSSVVRNVSNEVKGAIIGVLVFITLLGILGAFKGGKEGKPIKNWFLFWVAVISLILLIAYIILLSV